MGFYEILTLLSVSLQHKLRIPTYKNIPVNTKGIDYQ